MIISPTSQRIFDEINSVGDDAEFVFHLNENSAPTRETALVKKTSLVTFGLFALIFFRHKIEESIEKLSPETQSIALSSVAIGVFAHECFKLYTRNG